ncbi:MAG: DUF1565 domain-containing protein [Tetrasphaera sp.]
MTSTLFRRLVVPLALTGLTAGLMGSAQASAATTLYVAPSGSDANPGTASRPLRSVQRAVDLAGPGTTIRLQPGTYSGRVEIRKSGRAEAPITITRAGAGAVTLTSSAPRAGCGATKPAYDRTITILGGADYWRIDGLRIHNGIWIAGAESNAAFQWLNRLVQAGDWSTRRKVPGHGSYNPAAGRQAVDYLRKVTHAPAMNAADGIAITGNVLSGRGIYGALTRYGRITGNRISDIDCGTGPGIWLMTFSHGWTISGNDISRIARSSAKHYMQEGIRLGAASNYSTISTNSVHDLPGDGRAYNTDVDASYNNFHHNRASGVAIGYNDQMSGWSNRWEHNSVSGYRTYGFGMRLMDGNLATPSRNSSSNGSIVRCNTATGAVGDAVALGAGSIMRSTFAANAFPTVWLSTNLRRYWGPQDNTWNGSPTPPPAAPGGGSGGC